VPARIQRKKKGGKPGPAKYRRRRKRGDLEGKKRGRPSSAPCDKHAKEGGRAFRLEGGKEKREAFEQREKKGKKRGRGVAGAAAISKGGGGKQSGRIKGKKSSRLNRGFNNEGGREGLAELKKVEPKRAACHEKERWPLSRHQKKHKKGRRPLPGVKQRARTTRRGGGKKKSHSHPLLIVERKGKRTFPLQGKGGKPSFRQLEEKQPCCKGSKCARGTFEKKGGVRRKSYDPCREKGKNEKGGWG